MGLLVLVGLLFLVVVIGVVAHRGASNQPARLQSTQRRPPVQFKAPVPRTQPVSDLSALLPAQFVVLDVETTGLSPERDEIIEIGAIRATLNATTHSTFQTLVKPTREISKRVMRMTGITQEMVDADGIPIREALLSLMEFVGDLPLVTFNAEFDISFLCNAASRERIAFGNRYTCALQRARKAW